MNRLKGKRALITGASSGIGEACAKTLASYGVNLILAARRKERLVKLMEQLINEYNVKVEIHELDVRNRGDVFDFAEKLKQSDCIPDILINNAGLARGLEKLHEGKLDDWDDMIDTNVKGLLNVSRAIIPMMAERNSGHIVNTGSSAGHWVYPAGNVYNASKFAVKALNEAMNIDLLGTNLRVSSIDPGATTTEFSEVRFHGDKGRAEKVYKGFKPLSAEDIADAVCYVLNVPEHVNILNMVILPTAQRTPHYLHREE